MARRYPCITAFVFFLALAGTCELKAAWPENGTPVCTDSLVQRYPQMTTDGAGGAIITWIDHRSGYPSSDLYVQRIAANGDPLWAIDGVPICTAPGARYTPRLISDGSGGAIIIWIDSRSGGELYAQRINASGIIQWTTDGVAIGPSITMDAPNLISDGAGGAIITCSKNRGASEFDICAYRIDENGNKLWADYTVVCAARYFQGFPQLISDNMGGAIIVWEDRRNGITGGGDIYAQRISADGDTLWAKDGVPISTAVDEQRFPELASDGAGGAIITWQDNGFDPITSDYDIFAQRISADGDTLWAKDGVPVCTAGIDQKYPQIIPDGVGGAIIVWMSNIHAGGPISAQRINADGDTLWARDGIPIGVGKYDQRNPRIIPDGCGGAIITWMGSGLSLDIYVQHVNANGDALCPANGVRICAAANNQQEPQITSDGAGGAIVTWYDGRDGNDDIYAAKAPECVPVATLLQSFHVSPSAFDITIEWTLSEASADTRFHVLRAEVPAGTFIEIKAPGIRNNGLAFSVIDEDIEPGSVYRYRVEVSNEAGRRVLFDTDPITVPMLGHALHQNHPNPFNPTTTIEYSIARDAHVSLAIYDAKGEHVRTLVDAFQKSGEYRAVWDGTDSNGNEVASDVYFYRLKTARFTESKKLILLR